MKNTNYVRDENGTWFIADSKNEKLVKFAYSDDMEYAFQLGIERGHREVLKIARAITPQDNSKTS